MKQDKMIPSVIVRVTVIALIMACISACGSTKEEQTAVHPATNVQETATVTPPSSSAPSEKEKEKESPSVSSESEETTEETFTIKTGRLTMEAPMILRDKIVTGTNQIMITGDAITFYEARQYSRGSPDGELFAIAMFHIDDDAYLDLPSYDEYGILTSPEGEQYRVIIYYPSDVRFTPDTNEDYDLILSYKDQIFSSMKGANGYQLSR